jgi:hypothetical protein
VQEGLAAVSEVDERRDMSLRHDDDMDGPERARVTKRKHVVRLEHHVDRRPPAERFVAIEIMAHGGENLISESDRLGR